MRGEEVSDTPRTDADDRPYPSPDYTQHINFEGCDSVVMPPEEYAALYEHARQLERELASVTKGSLELEEERDELDRELQESDRRANSLERELTEAKIGAARYEYIRKLNPREFTALSLFCVTADVRFDEEVDRRRKANSNGWRRNAR
jgi:hypothetical protein